MIARDMNTTFFIPHCFWRSCLLSGAALVIGLSLLPAQAAVELRPGMTVEFATLAQAQQILAERITPFFERMSQFDRCVRMQTSRAVTETELIAFVTNQARAWSASEKAKVTAALNWFAAQTRELNLVFPAEFLLVKTTGSEEGNSAYLRGSSIILPQVMVSGSDTDLRKYLSHELFHEFMHHNPQLREILYKVIGFRLCRPVPTSDWLQQRRITDPNPGPRDFYIMVNLDGTRTPCMPVLYSKSTNYTCGRIFDFLLSRLLVLEADGDGFRASCLPNGEPRLLDPYTTIIPGEDYYKQIGINTSYTIHPEETLAENFVLVVQKSVPQNSPRVPYMLREVINNPTIGQAMSPAGRFIANLGVASSGSWAVETSADLKNWSVWEYATNRATTLEIIDPDAWINSVQFYRARSGDLPLVIPGDTNNLVWISPGTFLMGSPVKEEGRYTNEGPQTLVTLTRGFWMSKYEVTQGEFEAVMNMNPSNSKGLSHCPVEQVTWQMAVDYCARLNELAQTAGAIPSGWAYRLPTEAEWEYAARAGTTNRYSYGDDPEGTQVYRYATFMDNRGWGSPSRPVTAKLPNPWGLYGIYGNVGEWCQDWYGLYRGGTLTDPTGPSNGTDKVWRGGSQQHRHRDCRCACRSKSKPADRQAFIGFRVVLALI